jgi:inosine/xanthosine triphosphate pyrophosphatase family protein
MKLTPRHIQILTHFQGKIKEQQEIVNASSVEVQKLKKEYSEVVTKIHENRLTQGVE